MKKINLLLTALGGALILALGSCGDECDDVTCLNGGTCNEGDCECVVGYSGPTCEIADLCIVNDVTCENDGECVDGTCECATNWFGPTCEIYCEFGTFDGTSCVCDAGYEGDDCNTLSRDKMVGSYTGSDACSLTGPSGAYPSSIETATAGPDAILITGLWDEFFVNKITATVNGNDITIPNQEPDGDGFTIEGSGTYTDGSVSWSFTITGSGSVDQCTQTATKQ